MIGKFDSLRDSALHYLCVSAWANDSTGDVEAPTGYVWRISNSWEEVKPGAIDFSSVMEEWFESEGVVAREDFYRSLVGHFLVVENSQGFVSVHEFATAHALQLAFDAAESEWAEWAGYGDV